MLHLKDRPPDPLGDKPMVRIAHRRLVQSSSSWVGSRSASAPYEGEVSGVDHSYIAVRIHRTMVHVEKSEIWVVNE